VEDVLLIAADWQFRRLIYAQLLEEGYSVLALPALETALDYLLRSGEPPRLTVLDLHGQAVTGQQIRDLSKLTGRTPLILCGGAMDRSTLTQAGLPSARILLRPFAIGDLLQEVRRVVSWPASSEG
jgi:DNA-binding response OmpR family regulator